MNLNCCSKSQSEMLAVVSQMRQTWRSREYILNKDPVEIRQDGKPSVTGRVTEAPGSLLPSSNTSSMPPRIQLMNRHD